MYNKHFNKFSARQRGFTLIELLVVIGIIGILAIIVLVNVNSARNKAKDAVIKADFASIPASSENSYDTEDPNSYAIVFDVGSESRKAYDAAALISASATITDSSTGWCACAQLVSDITKYYCIDSARNAAITTTQCSDDCSEADEICDGM